MTTPFNSWGVHVVNGIEMYVWIYLNAATDEFIDARKYASEYDLRLKLRLKQRKPHKD